MYPDERVERTIEERFVPVRLHVRDDAQAYKEMSERFGAQWTPTTLVIDATGKERHRIEGFLPTDDFLAQLEIGAAKLDFTAGRFEEAERDFHEIMKRHPDSEAAAEAQYWAGVSRYKATNDAGALEDTAKAFRERYQDSTWAKKASVWEK